MDTFQPFLRPSLLCQGTGGATRGCLPRKPGSIFMTETSRYEQCKPNPLRGLFSWSADGSTRLSTSRTLLPHCVEDLLHRLIHCFDGFLPCLVDPLLHLLYLG